MMDQDNGAAVTRVTAGANASSSPQSQSETMETGSQFVRQRDHQLIPELIRVMKNCLRPDVDGEVLEESIRKTAIDPNDLYDLFKNLESGIPRTPKPESKGDKTGGWSFSCKPKVKISCEVTGHTCGAHNAILKQLQKDCKAKVDFTDQQSCDITIIFCPVTSRVGSDVQRAMKKASGDKPVVLVVMHHTRDEDFSIDITKYKDTYTNILMEVHVLFHDTMGGLLKCPRNDKSIKQMKEELYKHSGYLR